MQLQGSSRYAHRARVFFQHSVASDGYSQPYPSRFVSDVYLQPYPSQFLFLALFLGPACVASSLAFFFAFFFDPSRRLKHATINVVSLIQSSVTEFTLTTNIGIITSSESIIRRTSHIRDVAT